MSKDSTNIFKCYPFLESYISKELDDIMYDFMDTYPFVPSDTIKSIISDIKKNITLDYVKCFVNQVIKEFPYFSNYIDKLLEKYHKNIKDVIYDKCCVNMKNTPKLYEIFEYENTIYFVDDNGNLYDNENIFIGYKYEDKVILFIKLMDLTKMQPLFKNYY